MSVQAAGQAQVILAEGVAPARHMMAPSRARHVPTKEEMARRRRLVRLAKMLLPGLALVLLASIVLWPEFDRPEDNKRYAFRRTIQPVAQSLRVVSPRYQGVDDLSRPYTVTAEEAHQLGSSNVLDLRTPRADIVTTEGSWVYLQSETGRYDRPADHLDLNGRVTIFHDNGTTLKTNAAAVELATGTASGDLPVAAQGPFGTLVSEGFRLSERGAVVLFTGRARAVLEGKRP